MKEIIDTIFLVWIVGIVGISVVLNLLVWLFE